MVHSVTTEETWQITEDTELIYVAVLPAAVRVCCDESNDANSKYYNDNRQKQHITEDILKSCRNPGQT